MKNKYTRLKWIAVIIVSIIIFLIAQPANAGTNFKFLKSYPQQEVKGIVSDRTGMPLPGVTVIVKGKNRGTTTDIDGKYSLTTTPDDVLIFTYIGFKKVEVPLNGRDTIDIQMEEDIMSLDGVEINAGYYTVKERERTGNISRVTAEEIELQPVISPVQALQGRMAGVEVIPGGSHPGMASTIRIRGQNSLRSEGNFPLYIIDGVPLNSAPVDSNSLLGSTGIDPLNTLSLSNIKSIEILKDADATAIYGSRGANGVVLITTKRGANKKVGLEARVYKGLTTQPNRLDLLNTSQYLQIRKRAFENDGVAPTVNNAYDLVLWDQDRYTDWQDFLFGGTSKTTNANLAISGGNKLTTFRVGGSFFTQGTIYPGAYDYKKVTGDLSLNHTSENGKFNINLSANYGVDVNNLVSNLSLNPSGLPPNAPSIFTEDGTLNWEDWGEAGLNNPLAGYYNTTNTRSNNLITNLGLSYELLKGLRFRSSLGYTFYNSEELWKRPIRSYNPSTQETNNSFHLSSNRKSWIIEPQLLYNSNIGKLRLEAIVGATFQENSSNQLRLQGTGYASEVLIGNLAAAERIINASTSNIDYRYNAFFGRIGANWDKKYYLNLTGRRDGSSRFGPNNRFANFGAIGTAWIFTEEAFVEKALPFLSFGKLRGSIGTTGNDQIGDYGYLDTYEATRGPGGLYPTTLANPEFSWEVNEKLEGAVELGILKDRLRLGISWYRNQSSNQLVGYPLPAITGFNTVQANLPATVRNQGWEIEATTINFTTDKFRWQSSFNISFPKNELLSYPNLDQSSYANTYRVGHSLNISLLYQYDGIDPETGYYRIRDVNEDGRLDFKDRVVIQNHDRRYFGGINNNLTYKNFSLQFLWQFVKQDGHLSLFNAGALSNQRVEVLQALENQSPYQMISQTFQARTAYANVLNTTLPVVDASFLRLKTLSLGYTIPQTLLDKFRIRDLKFFIHGQNLITITPFEGLDPEIPFGGTAFSGLRTVSGGLQLNL